MIVIEKLLMEVKAIRKKYDLLASITGANFNIFQILGLQSREVRLHSSFIAELLNTEGSHGQGDKFLMLFTAHLKIKEFITPLSKTYVEHFTSQISPDGENGGRIDILLEDVNKKRIIIENKIYAYDQPKQLIRYKNFDRDALLLYLNLFGSKPLDESGKELEEGMDYKIISYENDIVLWLEACMKEAATLPIIRETIHQYLNLIKKLTNQSIFETMNDEITKLLIEQPEYFVNVPSIYFAYEKLKKSIYDQFFDLLEKKLIEKRLVFNIEGTDIEIQLQAGEGTDGFNFAYRFAPKNNQVRCNIENRLKNKIQNSIIFKSTNVELFEKYSKIITKAIPNAVPSEWSLGVYNPEFIGNKNLDQIDNYKLLLVR